MPLDDVPGSVDTSATLSVGDTFGGALETGLDWDWFAVDVVAGQTYIITMSPGTLNDPYLWFADASGNLVEFADNGYGGEAETYVWTADFTGSGFIIADSYYNNVATSDPSYGSDTGTYQLSFDIYDPGEVGAVGVSIDGTPTDGASPWVDSLVTNAGWASPTGDTTTTITYTFASGAGGPVSGLTWDASSRSAFEAAITQYEAIANIDFVYVADPNDANISWWLGSGADFYQGVLGWHYLPALGVTKRSGAFNTDAIGWTSDGLVQGGYGYVTIIHEMGHGLGLVHPHDSDVPFPGVTSAFDDYGTYDLNQGIWTTMSYNSGWPSVIAPVGATTGYEGSPMALDVAAIQDIYGANLTHKTGDDVYLLADVIDKAWMCVWDAGGTDVISGEGLSDDLLIDLRAATLIDSNAGGFVSCTVSYDSLLPTKVGGFTIANGVTIENAKGGDGNDGLIGNSFSNVLQGLGGNDVFLGSDGNDTLYGGAGTDTAKYSGNYASYSIVEYSGYVTVTGAGFVDRLEDIEYIAFDDLQYQVGVTGNTPPTGGVAINGAATQGATLTANTASLADADGLGPLFYQWLRDGEVITDATEETYTLTQADVGAVISVTVSYTDLLGTDESVTSDATASIANVNDAPVGALVISFDGSSLSVDVNGVTDADGIVSGSFVWIRNGSEIEGETGATLTLTGADFGLPIGVSYVFEDGGGATETVASSETFLVGTASGNTLNGSGGSDVIYGLGGADVLNGYSGGDRLYGGDDGDTLFGSNQDDALYGENGDDVLNGGNGADTLDGGVGADQASYKFSSVGVVIDLGLGTASGGTAEGDTLISIEDLKGSSHDDSLIGDGSDNRFYGQNGSDTLSGLGGNDRLFGEGGDDELLGGEGNDILEGGSGADTLSGGNGLDQVSYRGSSSGVTVSLATSLGSGGEAAGDTLISIEAIVGSGYGDVLTGDAENNRFYSLGGDDTIHGGDGVDRMKGGSGDDVPVRRRR